MQKRVIIAIIAILQACTLWGCGKKENTTLTMPKDSQYLVIYSDIAQPNGGYYYIDEIGNVLEKTHTLKMQDLICFDVSSDKIVISGERKNNTLILDRGSAEFVDSFVFLNDSSFSGLTAVKSNADSLVGVMNGNFSDNAYLNLLVLQTLDGRVIQERPLEIFAHSVIDMGEHTVVAGVFISNDTNNQAWCAEIYDCYNEATTSHKYEQYNCYWDILEYESSLVCIAEGKNDNKNIVVSIDKETFEVNNEIIVSDQLASLFVYNGCVYAVGNLGIYQIDFESGRAVSSLVFDNSLHDDTAYVNFSYFLDDSVYVFLRYADRKQTQESYEYGEMMQVKIDSLNYITTPISHPKRDGLNNIFIIPSSFITGK